MKDIFNHTIVVIVSLTITLFSCNNNGAASEQEHNKLKNVTAATVVIKQPSTFQDTLIIHSPAAVFYHPDSFQLLKIKAHTDSMQYAGSMHEYFYQMRNARIVIKKTWPALTIIEAKKYRYLLFIEKNGAKDCIDLDKKNDPYGLFVFDLKKPPRLIDMTNIETGISFYLNE